MTTPPTVTRTRDAINALRAALAEADTTLDAAIQAGDSETFDALLAYFAGSRVADLEAALTAFDPEVA